MSTLKKYDYIDERPLAGKPGGVPHFCSRDASSSGIDSGAVHNPRQRVNALGVLRGAMQGGWMDERLTLKMAELAELGERYRTNRSGFADLTMQMESLGVELVLEGVPKTEVSKLTGASLTTVDAWIAAREGD